MTKPVLPDKRPKYLNLLRIRLPVGGVVSILHRLSGLWLLLALPLLYVGLSTSLQSEGEFNGLFEGVSPLAVIALALVVVGLAHHLFAGMRFLALDLGWGEGREKARRNAWLVLLLDGLFVLLLLWVML